MGVNRQWRHPQWRPPGASYSCTFGEDVASWAQTSIRELQATTRVRRRISRFSPLNDIGADTGSMLTGKIIIGQSLLDAVLHLLSSLFQMEHSSSTTALAFHERLLLSWADRLEHFGYQFHLGARCDREHITVKVDGERWYLASGNTSPTASSILALISNDEFHAVQATPRSHWKKLIQLALSSLCPRRHLKPHAILRPETAIATRWPCEKRGLSTPVGSR